MTLTAALLDPLRTSPDAARPLITYYDDATGERIELSAVTTANWAAKAANLLREECDVEPGTKVALLLPPHWQTAAVLLAAWWCGAELVTDPATAEWVLCDADRLDLALAVDPPGGVVALSLDAFGKGVPGLPDGVLDFATEVRLQPDDFAPWQSLPPGAPALDGQSVSELLDAARAAGAAHRMADGSRVLSTLEWSGEGLVTGLLAPLAAGASLVQVRNPDPDRLEHKARSERTTVLLE